MKKTFLFFLICAITFFAYQISMCEKPVPSEITDLNEYPEPAYRQGRLIYDTLDKKIFVYDSFFVLIDSTQHIYSESYIQINSLEHTLWSLSDFGQWASRFPKDLLIEKIWEPQKYPNSQQCNHIYNSHDEFFVMDERGLIQMYSQRLPSGEHKLVMQTENPPYCDYWAQILPSFYKAPPYSKIKELISFDYFAKTNWVATNSLAQMRFTDEVFGTLDDEKKFYTEEKNFKIELMIRLSTDYSFFGYPELIITEDSSANTKILNIDFVLNENIPAPPDDPIGYVPSAEDFYYKQYSSKIDFDSFNKILVRFKQRGVKEFYDEQRIFLPCGLSDEYEIQRISTNTQP